MRSSPRSSTIALGEVLDRLALVTEHAGTALSAPVLILPRVRYDGGSGGFFRPHRDNTTLGTAHRRFACTINLNTQAYAGGDLRFPEFGPRTYRAPTGGAVVFSCAMLHEATPVTAGTRYAFLPFFYDEQAARQREQNTHSLTGQVFDRDKGEDEYALLASGGPAPASER